MGRLATPVSARLDEESFRTIAELAYQDSGLTLMVEKSNMIQSRLRHRLRALDVAGFPQYCALLQSDKGHPERRHLISALTTNVSHFFREEHHLAELLKALDRRGAQAAQSTPIRLWSAGCSRGQEPLSIAMTALENLSASQREDLRILATDVDPAVIRFAQASQYPERLTKGIPAELKQKYFSADQSASSETQYTATSALRSLIRYNELNLLADWPMQGKFDAIFCRNVVIYFDLITQNRLWPRFHAALHSHGLLFLGHSERISDPERFGFTCIAPTTYRPLT